MSQYITRSRDINAVSCISKQECANEIKDIRKNTNSNKHHAKEIERAKVLLADHFVDNLLNN